MGELSHKMWAYITGSSEPTEGKEGEKTPESGAVHNPILPTPKNDMDFQMEGAKILEMVRKYGEEPCTEENGWTVVEHATKDVNLYERKIPELKDSWLTLLKAE